MLGQYPKPLEEINNFTTVRLNSINIISLFRSYGYPYYLKIDLERYDNDILKAILLRNITPPYLSVEINNYSTFKILFTIGKYNAFKLVNGKKILNYYRNTLVKNILGKEIKFNFTTNSAGPFGNDIHGKWMNYQNLSKVISCGDIGWNDIHCSKVEKAQPNYYKLPEMKFKSKIKFYLNELIRNIF